MLGLGPNLTNQTELVRFLLCLKQKQLKQAKQESLCIFGLLCQAQLLRVPSIKKVKLVKPAGTP